LEINAEREQKFPVFAENIKVFQSEIDDILSISKHSERTSSLNIQE